MSMNESNVNVTSPIHSSPLEIVVKTISEHTLWVLIEPFKFGCFPVNPCAKLSIPLLKKIMIYVKSNNLFPYLTLKNWTHICKCKLNFSPDFAYMYIRFFDVYHQHMVRQDMDVTYWDKKCDIFRRTKVDKNKEFSVPTLEFLLFLYIQHSHRIMCKYRQKEISSPIFNNGSPDLAYPPNWLYPPQRGENYILGEFEQMKYIQTYIEDIIEFLQLSNGSSSRVSSEIISCLNFIIGGTVNINGSTGFCRLEDFLAFDDVRQSVDFDPGNNTVERQWLIEWIVLKLKLNPMASIMCFSNSRRVIKTGIWENTVAVNLNKCGGNDQPLPHRWFIISQVNEQVLCKDSLTPYSNLIIRRCNNSYIYVPGVFNFVSIEKCYNTTVFIGCVSRILRFVDCTSGYFMGLGRQVIIHDNIACYFNIHTPCPITMSGLNTSKLVFGPYATTYPKLKEHMAMAHLDLEPSLWSCVQGVADPDGRPVDISHRWELLDPKNLFEFGYPFKMDGETKNNYIPLPSEYDEYKQECKTGLHQWRKFLDGANLGEASIRIVHDTMLERFKEYLELHEYDFELDGLKSLLRGTSAELRKSIWPPSPPRKSDSSFDEKRNMGDDESLSLENSDSDSENSGLNLFSDDVEDNDVFIDGDEISYESEYDIFMKNRIAELVSRPLSADFDASGVGINDFTYELFCNEISSTALTIF